MKTQYISAFLKESNDQRCQGSSKDFVLDDMITDMLIDQNLNPIGTELFIRGRKLNITLVFMIQSYFAVPKSIRLNSTHYFIRKIPNKQKFQQIAFNHSSDIDFKDSTNLYCKTIFAFSY